MNRVCVEVAVLSAICLCSGCRNQLVIEDTPVEQIEVSQPPEKTDKTINHEVQKKKAVDDARCYEAVLPYGAIEIYSRETETRYYVPDMSRQAVVEFLDKYFPYQKKNYVWAQNRFQVLPEIKEEFRGDGIIPELDSNVRKPDELSAVAIQVTWVSSRSRYEWVYENPYIRENGKIEAQREIEERSAREAELRKAMEPVDDPMGFGKSISPNLLDVK